jgi:hypothetical protein
VLLKPIGKMDWSRFRTTPEEEPEEEVDVNAASDPDNSSLIDAQLSQAEPHGAELLTTEPRARTAHSDVGSGRILVDLTNGCNFAFPAHLTQELEDASPEVLAEVEVLGQGYGLHWEKLDVDLSVPGLLAGLFGTKAFMGRHRAARAGASVPAI